MTQAFQAITSAISSPRLIFLCPTLVLSFLRRVPSNWMISSSFSVLVHFANDTCPQHWPEHGSKDRVSGNRCKFTTNLSALTAVAPMHEQNWSPTAYKDVPAFKAMANPMFPQTKHSRIQAILWMLELFQAPDSLQLPTIIILKQLSALSAPRTCGKPAHYKNFAEGSWFI